MEYNLQEMLFMFFGGLGIFLFGIKSMGDGLQKSAGDRLRDILDKYTTNPFLGVLAGIIVTILLQTSTGTTVITVGLVSAGFMTLRQAIGVIMGANIGTTVTAFIIGIDIGEYALPMIAVGSALLFFFKKEKFQHMGQIIFGAGALFYGLELMGDGMRPLRTSEYFFELTQSMSQNPILGVVVGTVFTLIVQSSSATIGVLQELYAGGSIDLKAALPVLFGDNIGTTITAVLAALGASVAARRAAAAHVIFNLVGTAMFLIILPLFTQYIFWITNFLNIEAKMQIAFAHGTFNVANTLIQFWFIGTIAWVVTKLVPGEDSIVDTKAQHLDPIFIQQSPSIAVEQAKYEVIRMGDFAKLGLDEARSYMETGDKKHAEKSAHIEDALNSLNSKITDYLVQLAAVDLTEHESQQHKTLMHAINDIERIGDHVENIIELIDYKTATRITLSPGAQKELTEMYDLTRATLEKSLQTLASGDMVEARQVIEMEAKLDMLERQFRKNHVVRLNTGECDGQAGMFFVDMLSNLERIGDHAMNITEITLEDATNEVSV
ncbi:Na/Pi cotransporter family protein [Exiguobacterium sp. SH3S2]|uniref:Na/Pi cotransporter family protein n=1 Tax=unclassified Exiguobacterium TaxID=2644629 RepID=UPI00103F8F72|nr:MULTISPECIES: Na/Pi cotransporter family protein [unclassified Exiguobacterium]TCI24172.1 Na/Pi cotransporter family protein [Exiguobacterium sp. SH5S4]TCI46257.1 Na/Pi cotransporter family protein [Exiguobacterium sp. SH3S3]TCI56984.1 Na/Pi cotransporter family protein [Exiguobacterium sp. SH5S13]TCI59023.1 Na/Pi cotransporter family protein [Exiguobacterium sp. SH3S1]TCI61898.1 Na/Pi cotransporter family protein [Exiguobacterium sp. SH3S2]